MSFTVEFRRIPCLGSSNKRKKMNVRKMNRNSYFKDLACVITSPKSHGQYIGVGKLFHSEKYLCSLCLKFADFVKVFRLNVI